MTGPCRRSPAVRLPWRSEVVGVVALLTAVPGVAVPGPVSPVATLPGEVAVVAEACPTFSWTSGRADVPVDLVLRTSDSDGAGPALARFELPAGSASFTLPEGRCLEPGRSYAWAVLAPGDDLHAVELLPLRLARSDEWPSADRSAGSPIPILRSATSASGGSGVDGTLPRPRLLGRRSVPSPDARGEGSSAVEGATSSDVDGSAGVRGDGDTGVAGRAVSPEGDGVRGRITASGHPGSGGVVGRGTVGFAFGVVGIGTGAGVRAVQLDPAGGPDLRLDGAEQGRPSIDADEGGFDLASPCSRGGDCELHVENSGGGGMTLTVDGEPVVVPSTDRDTLRDLGCQSGDIVRWDAMQEAWRCRETETLGEEDDR